MTDTSLMGALDYAISVIESYQMDIRAASGSIDYGMDHIPAPGESLADQGFCQGTIYTNAVATIRKMARSEGA